MSLKEKIISDLKEAMKAGQGERVGLLRLVNSAIHNKEIEKRTKEKATVDVELIDDEVMQVLNSEVKKRRESIEVFTKGGRQDLAEKEQKELTFILEYLPKQMSVEEVEKAVDKIIQQNPGSDFGALMKSATQELKGRADSKLVSELIKKKLVK